MWTSVMHLFDVHLWSSWQWQTPFWLWLLPLPVLVWVGQWFWREQQQTQYAPKHLWQWVKVDAFALNQATGSSFRLLSQRLWRVVVWWVKPLQLLAWAWMLWVLAMAGPRLLQSSPETLQRAGVDILIALDVSRSMQAQDVQPSRFLFSKALIESWVNRLEPNDRLGLMVFAAKPHLVSPLTFDRKLFSHYLNLMSPNILPTEGSLVKSALGFGAEHLRVTAGQASVLVVLTDGEPEEYVKQADSQDFINLLAAQAQGQSTPQIWILGIGENQSVALPDVLHKSGRYHQNGVLVTTRLETAMLQQLAQQVNAQYWQANESAQFINTLLSATQGLVQQRPLQGSNQEWASLASGLTLLSALCLVWAGGAESRLESQAYQAFQEGRYEAALQAYDALPNYQGWMGAGAAAYKSDDLEAAVMYFRQAVLVGKTPLERSGSLYNLGNSYYQANLLNLAIESYQQALVYLPNDAKTQHNLALVLQRRLQEKGQQAPEEMDGEGQGKGNKSRGADGAFYGGQKPSEEAGEGIAGDAQDGMQGGGKEMLLPSEEDLTQFIDPARITLYAA